MKQKALHRRAFVISVQEKTNRHAAVCGILCKRVFV
jgi:hypothetical protein